MLTWIGHEYAVMEYYYFLFQWSAETVRSATPSWINDAKDPARRHKSLRNKSLMFSTCL